MRTTSCFQTNNSVSSGFSLKGLATITTTKLLYHAGKGTLRGYLFQNTPRGVEVLSIHWKGEEEDLKVSLGWAGLVNGEVLRKEFFIWIGPEGRYLFEGARPWTEDPTP